VDVGGSGGSGRWIGGWGGRGWEWGDGVGKARFFSCVRGSGRRAVGGSGSEGKCNAIYFIEVMVRYRTP
jgi:hypothetical protein